MMLKKYLSAYKPFLLFISIFFGVYIVLTFLYQYFLNSFQTGTADSITHLVALNTEKLISWFYQLISIEKVANEPFFIIYFQNKGIARIVEGCNGVSVIILFISFIVAFSGSLKNTLLYILGGSLFIHLINVIRIALLTVLMYNFPNQSHILHGVFFPLIIYGLVFILWVIWVNKFSKYAK